MAMRTWTRSLLRQGGGLDTTQVTHCSPDASLRRMEVETVGGVRSTGAEDADTLGKAQVFFQWKMVVARRIAARETLREEFSDLKVAIGRLMGENQILRITQEKQRVFRAWKSTTNRRELRPITPVFLRKFLRSWADFTKTQSRKMTKLTDLRRNRRTKLLKRSFFALKSYQILLNRCFRTIKRRVYTAVLYDAFATFQHRLRWRAKLSNFMQRVRTARASEALQAAFSHWKYDHWATLRSVKISVSVLSKKQRAYLKVAMCAWVRSVVKREKLRQVVESVARNTRRKCIRRFRVQSLKATAAALRDEIDQLPFEMEANFASELETRIKAMKTDFETERKEYLAQRDAMIERHMALKKAYGQHAGRIYESLSNERSMFPG